MHYVYEAVLCRIFCIISCGIVCVISSGFIMTAPKVLDAGSTEFITLSLFDVPNGGSVSVKLLKAYSDDVITETRIFAQNNYNTWGRLKLPDTKDTVARLHVEDNFNPGTKYKINATKTIRIRHKSVVTFIQTDKPIYKPGQTVRFRILPLDNQLLPLDNYTSGDVWIEDPSGIRISQWKKIGLSGGIVQLELPLSEEPVLGSWSIHCRIRDITSSQSFRVDEYVLPKFDVIIIPPPYIMADAQEIQAKICAQYTYGKKVDGQLKAKITYTLHSYESQNRALPFVEHQGPISGCADFVVQAEDLHLQYREFGYRRIKIFAEVVENGTEIKQNSTAVLEISHSPLEIKFLGADKDSFYFKPGLPYYGELLVSKPDGTPASEENIKVCAKPKRKTWESNTELCNSFVSDENGRVNFIMPAQTSSVESILLEARSFFKEKMYDTYGVKIYSPYSNIYLKAWYSPSDSYLQIQSITKEVKCDKLERVKIRYTTHVGSTIKFYHQVISRGRIVQQGSHHRTFSAKEEASPDPEDPWILKSVEHLGNYKTLPKGIEGLSDTKETSGSKAMIGEFKLSFDARATMSPVARLLVYYVREDGEVVADTKAFRISHCLQNQVKLHFRHPQQYPNTEAALFLSANPNSVCGIGLIDKSVHLLRQEEQFSKQKVFEQIETFDIDKKTLPKQTTEDYCQQKTDLGRVEVLDESNVLRDLPIDDLLRRRKRSILMDIRTRTEFVDSIAAFEDAGVVVITDFVLENRPCSNTFLQPDENSYGYSINAPVPLSGPNPTYPSKGKINVIPEGFPEPSSQKTPPKSKIEIRSYFPETWLWEMHNISSSGEMALKRELPHTITEWIGKAVCVHPTTGLGISDDSSITTFQPFFASFSLPYSVVRGEVVTVVVSIFNYLTECLPIKLAFEASESFKIMDGTINPKLCVCGEKSESWQFHIRPVNLGYINITVYVYSLQEDTVCENEITARLSARDAVTHQLLVEAEGFPKEKILNLYFCPESVANKTFNKEIDLLLPDDTIADSASGFVFVTGDLMGPALSGLEGLVRLPVGCGEQNMVLFTPNIFVLDYLISTNRITDEIRHKATDYLKTGYQRELRYRHEDGSYSAFGNSDESGSLWLTAFVVKSFAQARNYISIDEGDLAVSTSWIVKQQLENGCFPAVGEVHNKALTGGLSKNEESLAPLTAFILISLLESNYRANDTMDSAIFCLKAEKYPSTYSLALFAYAAALAKDQDAEGYLNQLEAQAIKSEQFMYWDYGGKNSRSINVEIAGYAILTILKIGGEEFLPRALPIVRWITKQRNSKGGFVSTQDTVIALQALAEYGTFNSGEQPNISINIESEELVHSFEIRNDNKLLMQTVKLPAVPTVVDFQATGEGCALAQFFVKYNVATEPKNEIFDLKVLVNRLAHRSCDLPVIEICMRYNVPDQVTNMVIVEIKMVSGYAPDEFELHMLHNDKNLGLRRHDVKENKVIFYFRELTNRRKCFEIYVKNEINVDDVSAATVKIYDYYQPERQATTNYQIPVECSSAVTTEMSKLPPLSNENVSDVDQEGYRAREFSPDIDVPQNLYVPESTEIHTNAPAQHSTTNIQAYAINYLNDNETTQTVFSEVKEEVTEISVNATTTMRIITMTSTENVTNFTIDKKSMHDIELSDSAQPSNLIENFVEVDEDLNFPEGIEGNQPVSVFPPETISSSHFNNSLDCPRCMMEFPLDFPDSYCSAIFVIRMAIRNVTTGNMKILNDVTAKLTKPKAIKEFGFFSYENLCDCPAIKQVGNVFVLGFDENLWQQSFGKHYVTLNSNVQIISPPSKAVRPPEIKEAWNHCNP